MGHGGRGRDLATGGSHMGKDWNAWNLVLAAAVAWGLVGAPGLMPAPMAQAQAVPPATHLVPPKGRTGVKRIMDPALPNPVAASVNPTPGRVLGPEAFKWFWTEVSPARSAAHAARWAQVLGVIEKARASGKPVFGSTSTARSIHAQYGAILEEEAARRNLSLPLLIAVIAVESGGNPGAVSPKGAGGLMQLMPGTADRFGVTNAMAPAQNIRGGARYLDWLLTQFDNDAVLALAGYNAGEGAVWKNGGVPPYRETRDYVAKVAGAYAAARALCAVPPSSPRDTCKVR